MSNIEYQLGTVVRYTATFLGSLGAEDPTAVSLTVRSPSATTVTTTWDGVAHPSPGVYVWETTYGEVGAWTYELLGTGAVSASAGGSCTVVGP